jgi:hypothetical protein
MALVMTPAPSSLKYGSKNSSSRSLSGGSTHSGGKMLTSTLCVPLAFIFLDSNLGTSSVPSKSVSGRRNTAPPLESACAANSLAPPGPCGASCMAEARSVDLPRPFGLAIVSQRGLTRAQVRPQVLGENTGQH